MQKFVLFAQQYNATNFDLMKETLKHDTRKKKNTT